ncbi:DUF262 domain-containing protein [Bacteroidales bacterium OttesenSCG-928-B11]|nr:DUF262 domain-containing protein [Bacteroidales bacterium OttesenSCG-928-B11]
MVEKNVELTPLEVGKLLGMNFFIPAYQRGYRWTSQQVKDLLNDINSFTPKEVHNSDDKTWYCLQPIVVKVKNEQWEVIDGQQRLTTIYLILHYLNQGYVENRRRKLFKLEYETRNTEESNSKNFLSNVETKTEQDALANIDYFHILQAYQAIIHWFENKGDSYDSNGFESKFLNNTKVIWYETNEDDAVQIFTRINMGKIPLTNAELIKALFLNSSNFKTKEGKNDEEKKVIEDKIRLKQVEIANEWDFIEYSLHNEEFWWFINRDENEKDTRIEFLFELIVGLPEGKNKKGKDFKTFEEYYEETGDDYYTYREFDKKFKDKSEKEIENNWEEVKRYFQTLQDWFDNRELYHKIGFLVTLGEDIKKLIDNSQTKNKSEFIEFINGKIKDKFANIQLADIEYNDGSVTQILLLHNIQTMLNNKKENSRFPFNRYKKEKWDIEHIHAKASEAKVKDDFNEQKIWLSDNFEKEDAVHNNDMLNKRIESFKKPTGTKDDNFQEIIGYVLGNEDNNLRNLCLLDKGTNRSYKNDSFKKKREKIIAQEKQGTFIPICTRNVFMKYYSKELKQLGQWSEIDRTAYFENIKEVLNSYLPTQNS